MGREPCRRCPCKDACLRWDAFCAAAAEHPADPVKLQHICNRSRMGAALVATPVIRGDHRAGADTRETVRLVLAIRDCPYYSRDSACGCAGAKCGLRRGAHVAPAECIECLKRFG